MLKFRNPVRVEIVDGDNVEVLDFFNGMTDEGRQYALGVALNQETPEANWYVGLISDTNFVDISDSDTMLSKSWQEESSYSEAERQAWLPVASTNSLENTVAVSYNFVGDATAKGLFICSDSTKGGTLGKLWATALFPKSRDFTANTAINVFYKVEAV